MELWSLEIIVTFIKERVRDKWGREKQKTTTTTTKNKGERSLDSCVFSGKCEMGCKCENDSVSFFFILITEMHTFAMYSLANLSLLL